jgi:soluble cytochrome b562
MREPGIPDWWAEEQLEDGGDAGVQPESRPAQQVSDSRYAIERSTQTTRAMSRTIAAPVSLAPPPVPIPEPQPSDPPKPSMKLPRLRMPSLQVCLVLLVLGFVGSGFTATALLLKMPARPNCPSIFWPLASASMRLYCAQSAAEKKTVNDLLEAIALVNTLPEDHPLRETINGLIAQWTQEVLDLAEDTFQAGKLTEAIEIARKVPLSKGSKTNTEDIEKRIDRWQKIWSKADGLYKEVEAMLRKRQWGPAFRQATLLLSVGNRYWETTKYQEITQRVQSAREDGAKLIRAEQLAESGTVDDLVEAIKLAEKITVKSYVYDEARKALKEFGRQLLKLAESALEARDLPGAISIARKVTESTQLKSEARDFMTLARAQSQTWEPTVGSLEGAIQQAQKLEPSSPLYNKAQKLIAQWQQSIEQVTVLEQARDYARTGSISDLTTAIAQAQLIPQSNPMWEEAQREIGNWRGQIETTQDQPYLDEARRLARQGNLPAAIEKANQISSGRALYGEAQDLIGEWQSSISRDRDKPILSQAQAFANSGSVDEAIATAQRIPSGSALYSDAQDLISSLRGEREDRRNLDDAYSLASRGSVDGLTSAIAQVSSIPSSSPWKSEADRVIQQWSQQLYDLAVSLSSYDIAGAIAVAEKIPPYTSVYDRAQGEIQGWQKLLAPPPAPVYDEPAQTPVDETPAETDVPEPAPVVETEPAPVAPDNTVSQPEVPPPVVTDIPFGQQLR